MICLGRWNGLAELFDPGYRLKDKDKMLSLESCRI